jgi:putative thioredoxin
VVRPRVDGVGAAAAPDPAPAADPGFAAAAEALARGDLDGAAAEFSGVLERDPGDARAKAGLAQVELLRRTSGRDAAAVRRAAAERPTDPQAQCDAADLELVGGHVEDALRRLLDAVARTSGADRDAVRVHLLSLFDAVGADDPRVVKGRTALASLLF